MMKRLFLTCALLLSCLGIVIGIGSCAATGGILGATAMSIGQNLLGTAEANYAGEYSATVESMLNAMLTDAGAAGFDTTIPQALLDSPISLDVAVLKENVSAGQSIPVPLPNGSVLVDGRGDPNGGDNLKISFEADQECYVYVLAIDGTGWAQPIFPSESSHQNPVQARRQYVIPDGQEWFPLDEFRGIETFYFMASHARRPDLETQFEEMAGRTRPTLPSGGSVQVAEAAVVERGLGARRQGKGVTVVASGGSSSSFNPTSFVMEQGASDLVITRWFRHQ